MVEAGKCLHMGDANKADYSVLWQATVSALYIVVWIALSSTVILYNKWILSYYGFTYPITLTLWHMAFSGALAFLIIRSGYVAPAAGVDMTVLLTAIFPIAALFSGTLWLGNAAYMYLSVSFIQMLKALMPVAVFASGCLMGTETYSNAQLAVLLVITGGVAIASFGELNFVILGVIVQLTSICTESLRLTLVQILLQKRGLTLNPITTMYYIAPASFVCLSIPWALMELPRLVEDSTVSLDIPIFLSNAMAAFALNMSVFLLIGKTSALTMNIAGVLKDWLLIALSYLLFQAAISPLNLGGYLFAFGGVCWYNYMKMKAMQERMADAQAVQHAQSGTSSIEESKPILKGGISPGPKDAALQA